MVAIPHEELEPLAMKTVRPLDSEHTFPKDRPSYAIGKAEGLANSI